MKKMMLFIFLLVNVYAVSAYSTIGHYRWRNDDGTETSATWKAATDAPLQISTHDLGALRLRMDIEASKDATIDPLLQYSKDNGTTWITMDNDLNTVNDFRIFHSGLVIATYENNTYFSRTTQQISSGASFVIGRVMDFFAPITPFTLTKGQSTEYEYGIYPTSHVETSQTYIFKMVGVSLLGKTPTLITGDCFANPSAPVANANQILCNKANATLADLVVSGANIQWFDAASGGTLLPITTPLANGKLYYCQQFSYCTVGVPRTAVRANVPNTSQITSFMPEKGAVGSTVILTGTNFNPIVGQNIVFFGATKATVTGATTTSLTVTVPLGATYQYISVTNLATNTTIYSAKSFQVTSSGSFSFRPKLDLVTSPYTIEVQIGDIDGDGKPDLIVANFTSSSVSIFRNTSSLDLVSFAPKVDFSVGANPMFVAVSDIDGDGKLDLAVANTGGQDSVSILRNTATVGIIDGTSFATKVDFRTGQDIKSIVTGDIDGDGKPDLVVSNYGNSTVSVFQNTAISGVIDSNSFAGQVAFTTRVSPYSLAIGDLDGDGKPDLVVTSFNTDRFSILRNTAGCGAITSSSFASKVDYNTGASFTGSPSCVKIGDIDGDGKPDLVLSASHDLYLTILRNNASMGSINTSSFESRMLFNSPSNSYSVSIGDVDGDGKQDLALANYDISSVSLFRNKAISGRITDSFDPVSSLELKRDYLVGSNPYSVSIGDLNGDGKPDLVVANSSSNSNSVSVLQQVVLPQGSLTGNGTVCSGSIGQLTWTTTDNVGPFTVVYNDGVANRTATNVVSGVPFNVYTNSVDATTTYTLVAVTGTDGIKHTAFNVNSATITAIPIIESGTTITACDSYLWSVNGMTYTNSGIYTFVKGCVTETLDLTITPSSTNTEVAVGCDRYAWSVNGMTYTNSGIYTFGNGCVTETLDLTITPSSTNTTTASACDSYLWSVNGMTYTNSGVYTFGKGCVTETLDLTITPSSTNTTTASACDSYLWSVNGMTYTNSGTYTFVKGCVTETLDLTITPSSVNTTTASVCDSYLWSVNGMTYTTSGVYTFGKGCVSETLDLSITPSSLNTTTASACDSYLWSVNGMTYAKTGIYTFVKGCVTETLDLTITPSSSITTIAYSCNSYFWSVNGMTYAKTGVYTFVKGCVTETLGLTIMPSSTNTTTTSACDSYLWSVNGMTYTNSGTYTFGNGCVTETLDLTITPSSLNTTTASACDSYLWSVNGMTYAKT
ncbi:FG-GAP-like repeat-containing protein, partial [Flavobacterium restrictum]|uniref:FG-GAP-like repeat-containing protein n=1 Tax=Flavobacterium restrictum TaxID=2594428 RepID=UPI00163DE419